VRVIYLCPIYKRALVRLKCCGDTFILSETALCRNCDMSGTFGNIPDYGFKEE